MTRLQARVHPGAQSDRIAAVRYTSRDLIAIASLTSSLNVEGHRADLVILKTARAQAAFDGRDRINETEALSQVIVTDTIPLGDKLERCPKLKVTSVAALLGKTIHNIHTGSSVSVLFV